MLFYLVRCCVCRFTEEVTFNESQQSIRFLLHVFVQQNISPEPRKKNSRTRNLSNRIVCQFQCDEESILYVLALTFTQLSKNLRQQHIRIKTKIRPKRSSTLSRIFQMFMVKTEHKLKHKQSIAKSGMISIPFGLRGKVCV